MIQSFLLRRSYREEPTTGTTQENGLIDLVHNREGNT